jgi:hypothetical protein
MKRTAIAAALAALFVGTAAQAGDTEIIIYKQPEFRGQSYLINGEVANIEAGLAGEGSSMVVKGGFWEVCTQDHFKGNCYVIGSGQYPYLRGLDDRIVSARFLGTDQKHAQRAMVYENQRFAKREARREERREERLAAREDRMWEGRRWSGYGAVDLYGRPDFRGRSVRIEDNERDLQARNFDGRASSAIVHEGTWQACSEPGFRGQCAVLRKGEYPNLAMLDDRISSLRQLR